MKLNIIDEVELFNQCLKVIHDLPDYLKSSSNSISSTVFFIPLDRAYSRGELLFHLEMLEQGLMDEKTIDSIAGKNVLDLYRGENASKQTRAQISKLANYIRLLLVKLASNGVLTLDALFKVSIHSQTQFDTVIIYDDVYPESVLQALILSTDARVKSHSDQLPVRLLDAANTELAYKTRVAAYQTLARACLTQGVRTLSDFKFEHWADFYSDYRSTPELPAITISSIISVIAKYNNDPEIENQFKNFTTSHRTNPREDNSHTESVYLSGDRALAKKLLGQINYNRNHTQYSHSEYVRYSKNDSTKILSYPYWNSDGIVLADFIPSNINQNQDHKTVWKLAQIDFLERKVESSTKKVSQNRLAVFNIYLFSYLPSFFSKFGSEHIKYPNLPKDFISAIFVQRSSIFDYQSGIASDAVYPVPLEEFVFSFDLTRRKITTDNDNGIKDVMREISLFFEHLVAINVGNPDSAFFVPSNPIKLSVQKTKGKKYLKTRKQVMSINYWSGFRLFLRTVVDKLLDDNLAIVSGELPDVKDLSKYPINKEFNLWGTKINIETLDLSDIDTYYHRVSKARAVLLPNSSKLASLVFMSYSGQRYSNTHWLDHRSFNQMVKDREMRKFSDDDLIPIVINTDKARTTEFLSFIPYHTYQILLKVKSHLETNKYHWILDELDYKNSETTKWSKIVPLFRTSKEHSESIPPMAILLQQYELCLFNANIDTESNVFFMSGKNIAPDEFVHFIENDIQLPPYTQAQVKYFDEDEVTFSPVKVGSLITPHSLRAMIDSVYSPALGEKIVSQLMTGQTEAAVGYYTVELDDASSDLLHHMSSLMNLSGRRIANNISLDKADFLNRLSKGTAEEDYQTISLSFGHDIPNLDSDLPSTGLSALRLATASDLAFNRTHICPFNNKCPRSIVIEIGEFSCSNCPYTVTTTNHIPAIAGEIRRLSEPLVSANKKLKNTLQDSVDMEKLKAQNQNLLREATNWYVRLKVMHSSTNELFIISEDGRQRLLHDTPITSDVSPLQSLLRRLEEAQGSDILKTDNLKLHSARFLRRAQINASQFDWDSLPELNEIDYAYNQFKILCDIQSLDIKETLRLLDDKFDAAKLLELGIGVN